MEKLIKDLKNIFPGEFYSDKRTRKLYATDASVYQEMPLAVTLPKDEEEIEQLIEFAHKNKIGLIPRTAGTSLAGQVVGNGIIVDVSKYFTEILEINKHESWVRLQPGVVRNELNQKLKEKGLFFGPETSTASRAMIGGMIGNNSCGSNSLIYGSTRDQLIEVKGFLADGTKIHIKDLSPEEFEEKCRYKDSSEGKIYQYIKKTLSNSKTREAILNAFPDKSIHRRNTGYALDALLEMEPFGGSKAFNFCKLIAGSEGTLFFITEAKLKCHKLPPQQGVLICAHFKTMDECLRANSIAVEHKPNASELMDHHILQCTQTSITYKPLSFFVEGSPAAILAIEFRDHSIEKVEQKSQSLIQLFKEKKLGYAYPLIKNKDIPKVWALRAAGLGLLSNIPGDTKPVALVEDAAVKVEDLPEYVKRFGNILAKYNLGVVHYGHAGSGELHLRPIINLKSKEGNKLFKTIAKEVALLVKEFNGSLSGEHGDGRLRGEFLPEMLGNEVFKLCKELKNTWDPQNTLNPQKIIDVPSMNSHLRYIPGQDTPDYKSYFDFSENQGILRLAEMCNGSADCRKSHLIGGIMCPSFMATKNEKDSTRARANILRNALSGNPEKAFQDKDVMETLELCLSCKGCKSECPSNVDMTKLKAEYTAQYYDLKGRPLKVLLFGRYVWLLRIASKSPFLWNTIIGRAPLAWFLKSFLGIAKERNLPKVSSKKNQKKLQQKIKSTPNSSNKKLRLLIDEFIFYQEAHIATTAIELLEALNYEVIIFAPFDSGRVLFSKGLLRQAKKIANYNIQRISAWATDDLPIIGIEPSAILSFKDEYPNIVDQDLKAQALKLKNKVSLIDEFINAEIDKGNISRKQFKEKPEEILFHGHCHQKVLSESSASHKILSFPRNYKVEEIKSGCCGMAGSFGYDKKNYKISQKIGELILFPRIEEAAKKTIISATGTSCRQQIKDKFNKEALHPIQILKDALN